MCRAKLGAQCVLRCPIEKRKRRKAIAAANAAAVAAAARAVSLPADGMLTSQASMRESVSSTNDSLDDDMDISQEPTGMQCHCYECIGIVMSALALGNSTCSISWMAFAVGQGQHAHGMQQAAHFGALVSMGQ